MVVIRRVASTDGWEWEQDALFWQKVNHTDDCWLWTAHCNQDGYGVFGVDGTSERAHRLAWQYATGQTLTPHDTICHTCDVPNCVRNDEVGTYRVNGREYARRGHLYLATQAVNVADRDAKSRGNWATGDSHGTRLHPETVTRGTAHVHAKLTDEDIAAIRATYTGKYGELTALGKRFGVTPQAIFSVVRYEGWQHVRGEGTAVTLDAPKAKPRGERHSQAKLTETDVRAIRTRYAAGGISQYALAAEFGINVASINNIVNRKTWTHVD